MEALTCMHARTNDSVRGGSSSKQVDVQQALVVVVVIVVEVESKS